MRNTVKYVVTVGAMEWGSKSILEDAFELYEDAKENNSDVFITLSKVTTETLKHVFVGFENEKLKKLPNEMVV